MIGVAAAIKKVFKKVVFRDWETPRPTRFGPLWLLVSVIAIGTVVYWRDFPMNGNPFEWANANSLYEEGTTQAGTHNNLLALSKLQQAVNIYPNDVRFLNALARIQVRTGNAEQAMQTWNASLKLKPAQPDIALTIAQRLAIKGNAQEAMQLVDDVLKASPANSEALAMKALILKSQEKASQAEKVFEKTYSVPRDSARFWNLAGSYYNSIGKNQEAEAALRQAAELEPATAMYQAALADFLVREKKWSDAEYLLGRATKVEPECAEYWFKLAQVRYNLNKPEDAITALSTAVELDAANPAYLERLGQLQREMKHYPEAAAAFKRATELDPGRTKSWDMLIDSLVLSDRHAEAKVVLTRFMNMSQSNESNPVAWSYLGQLMQHDGNQVASKAAYKKAISLSKNSAFSAFCQSKIVELEKNSQNEVVQ